MTIPALDLARGGADFSDAVSLDPSQVAVLQLADGASASVIGAPGTGKTTTLIELVADRVGRAGWLPEHVLALAPTRTTASALRDKLALRIAAPTSGPLARTVASFAFEVAGYAASVAGMPPPRLITGGEQDSDIAHLLAGHIEDGNGPAWPDPLAPQVRTLRSFRTELRDLSMRATDHGVSSNRLRSLADIHGRSEWRAAADFFDEYEQVSGFSRPRQFDSSELVRLAVSALEAGDVSQRVAGLRLIVVDDLQEATMSTLELLRALATRGAAIVAFGDPDVAANAFRGGDPAALGSLASVLGLPQADTFYLRSVHRQSVALRALTSAAVSRIGAAAAGRQRAAFAARDADVQEPIIPMGADSPIPRSGADSPILRIEAPTRAREHAAIARYLRERHLLGGVDWHDMAVVVRSGGQVPGLARALALAEVPTRTTVAGRPLRNERAARALLTVVDVGMHRSPLTPVVASDILLGPFGGLDRLGLRRLRLALRAEELAGGGTRSSDDLLVEGLSSPGRFQTIDHRIGRTAARVGATLAAVADAARSGGAIEDLLWLVWDRSGLAPSWREQALGTGHEAAEANRDLDGVVALFTAAKRYSERRPDAPPSVFLDQVLDADVADDVLAPQARQDAVLITPPPGAIGLEFDTVVVAELQEGVWPNRRPRGSLLGSHELVRVLTRPDAAPGDERKTVLDDELRMFALAVSRSSSRVVLSAVANDDEAPSVLFSLLPDGTPLMESPADGPMTLRGVTGRLRRRIIDPDTDDATRADAAATLAFLERRQVSGAGPADWHGLLDPSTTGPLFHGELVPISPSRLERFEQSPLDWFVETIAGSKPTVAMSVGTILHWAMETATDPSVDAIWSSIEGRWQELLFESPWLAEHERRAARVLAGGIAEYLADFDRERKQLVGAERRFAFELDGAMVSGSIDRVERARDGRVLIVDLKTGTPITNQSVVDAHPQLGAYQLAYRHGLLDEALAQYGEHSSGGASLLYVKKGRDGKSYREARQAPLDDELLEGFRTRIRQAAEGMAAAEFSGTIDLGSYGLGNVQRLRLHRVRAVSSD